MAFVCVRPPYDLDIEQNKSNKERLYSKKGLSLILIVLKVKFYFTFPGAEAERPPELHRRHLEELQTKDQSSVHQTVLD